MRYLKGNSTWGKRFLDDGTINLTGESFFQGHIRFLVMITLIIQKV